MIILALGEMPVLNHVLILLKSDIGLNMKNAPLESAELFYSLSAIRTRTRLKAASGDIAKRRYLFVP
jgi:hypothetical protein